MLLPLITNGNFGRVLATIGLAVYDWLANVAEKDRRRMLTRKQTLKAEPLLRKDVIEGGGIYSEYRTDDARLVLSVALTAQQHGATIMNYVEAVDFLYLNKKMSGVKAKDVLTGEEFFIQAEQVVNAAGPWVDELRSMDYEEARQKLSLSKGVHIVVDRNKLPLKRTVYFDNADGRMIFAIPRGASVYLGTTDTLYDGDKQEPQITIDDVEYILDACNLMFPEVHLKISDVHSGWSGLRPLIFEKGKSSSELSRKDEIFYSRSGLISIAGGKLTGYRKMAERVVNIVAKRSSAKTGKCITAQLRLVGGEYANYEEVEEHVKVLADRMAERSWSETEAEYLVHNYGRQADQIFQEALKMTDEPAVALSLAELAYTLENEFVERSVDFFERRTGRLNFRIKTIPKVRERVMAFMAEKQRWTPERLQEENRLLDLALKRVSTFSR
ncbi:MAG: glycerol-3-phosphate dehydrogenase/oxidase [Flavobacteriales bacterium]|nr:glycerol-3-phosphate dehydrogenase/oxidase [Flavobacteriales bacterium]